MLDTNRNPVYNDYSAFDLSGIQYITTTVHLTYPESQYITTTVYWTDPLHVYCPTVPRTDVGYGLRAPTRPSDSVLRQPLARSDGQIHWTRTTSSAVTLGMIYGLG